jgi:hypothetical protein
MKCLEIMKRSEEENNNLKMKNREMLPETHSIIVLMKKEGAYVNRKKDGSRF